MSQVTEQSVRFQTALASIKLIQASAVLDLTEDDFDFYHLLEGFPFIQEPPSGDLQERVLIRHHDYDQCFQSVQLLQWNSQVKFNVTVYRNLPTTRDSIMTS